MLVEGNHYFPPEGVNYDYLRRTRMKSLCPWKGLALDYSVQAGGQVNKNAAWHYPHPSPLARKIKNHVAFWNGVQVEPGAAAFPHAVPGAVMPPGPGAGNTSRSEG